MHIPLVDAFQIILAFAFLVNAAYGHFTRHNVNRQIELLTSCVVVLSMSNDLQRETTERLEDLIRKDFKG